MFAGHSRAVPTLFSLLLVFSLTASAAAQDDIFQGGVFQESGLLGKSSFSPPSSSVVTASGQFTAATGNQPAMLYVTAMIENGWHIFSLTQQPGGPLKSKITLEPSDQYRLAGDWTPVTRPEVHEYPDAWPGLPVEQYEGSVTWQAPVELAAGVDPSKLQIQGALNAQACKESCLPPRDYKFTATLVDRVDLPRQEAQQAAALGEYRAEKSHTTIQGHVSFLADGKMKLVLTAIPAAGWHVYAIAEPDEAKIAKPVLIELTETSGLRVGRPVPDRAPIREPSVAPEGGIDEIYKAPITWTLDIEVPEGAAGGAHSIAGIIGYQACDDANCDFLKAARFDVQLPIPLSSATAGSVVPLAFTEAKYGEAEKLAMSRPAGFDESSLVLTEAGQAERPAWMFMLFGLLGGLILNLMPCVLPVVGLKILSFVEQAGHDRRRVFALNLWYSFGLLSVFMALATLPVVWSLLYEQQFIWGQQFGNSTFTVVLAALVFAMGLSLIGVWEIPIPGFVGSSKANHLAAKEGPLGAFAKGAITTVLATPCSGPFLGTALGWALRQPPYLIYAVFACVGIGMASPYLIIGAFPRLIRFLPKPGAWMETFKQLMGFVLMGTVVYLLTLIHWTYLVPTVALLIGIWAACWWIGKTPLTADFSRKATAWAAAILFTTGIGFFAFGWLDDEMAARFENTIVAEISGRLQNATAQADAPVQDENALPWQPFSKAKLVDLTAANTTVIVDFTAKWCPNCLTLKKFVLNTPEVKQVVDSNGIVPLVADLDASPENPEMLSALQAGSIPVLAIFPAGDPNHPIIFRDGYTQQMLLDALAKAGPTKSSQANVTAIRGNAQMGPLAAQ